MLYVALAMEIATGDILCVMSKVTFYYIFAHMQNNLIKILKPTLCFGL